MVFDLRASSKPKMILKGHENNGVNYLDFIKLTEDSKKILTTPDEPLKKEINNLKDLKPTALTTGFVAGANNSISPLLKKNTLTDISNAPTLTGQTAATGTTQAGSIQSFKSISEFSKKKEGESFEKSKNIFLDQPNILNFFFI